MNRLPSLIQGFLTDRLPSQRGASPNTIAAYRDAIKMLLVFAAAHHKTAVDALSLGHLDATTVAAFLTHLETDRGNSPATRNARLAAIHSLFRYAALSEPEHADSIARVLDIPPKRCDTRVVDYLREDQLRILLAAPDPTTWTGRRDRLMLHFMAQTGLRVTETATTTVADIYIGACTYVQCQGKGRKQRTTPLTADLTAQVSTWIALNRFAQHDALFPSKQGMPLTRNAIWRLITKHAQSVADQPEMATARVTPHVLRHTAAMRLLRAGNDIATIALWLGHEQLDTTLIYLHADLERKQSALEKTASLDVPPGRYKPPADILAFLQEL